MPITFLAALLNKKPCVSELEYFIKLDDPETFDNIHKIKDDPEMIKSLGYKNYKNCLQQLCKFYYDPETKVETKRINNFLAKGFLEYGPIKNSSQMNFPTINCYLSGDYTLDRKNLLKNLIIYSDDNLKMKDYYITVTEIINTLPEDKLLILLKNWSGTTVIKKSYEYKIGIKSDTYMQESNIHFGTCDTNLSIHKNMIDDPEMRNILIDILTTPMNSMVDKIN
jgi:hypothetical protein